MEEASDVQPLLETPRGGRCPDPGDRPSGGFGPAGLACEQGYGRRRVLEQDTAIAGQEPPVGSGPINTVRGSLALLDTAAPEKEEERR